MIRFDEPEGGRGPAFYISAREGELSDDPLALTIGRGPSGDYLTYWDETEGDRDAKGVLWARCSHTLSRNGRPVGRHVGELHPDRQYGTMLHRYCGVGGCPARTPDMRYLHLVTEDERVENGAVRTIHPPVCLDHAAGYAASDPRLRDGYTTLLVGASTLWGVIGTTYAAVGSHAVRPHPGGQPQLVPYGADELRWVLAIRLVRDLTDVEEVDLYRVLRESPR